MNGIGRRRAAGLALIAVICLVPGLVVAQAPENVCGTATEELRSLMTTALSAARAGDQAKLEEITRNLMIPDYEAWFKSRFGEDLGAKMAAAYGTDFDKQEKWLPTLFESLSKQEGEILVEDVREPRYAGTGSWCGRVLLGAVKKDSSFYRVSLQQVQPGGARRVDLAGYFTLVEGSYRRLDCKTLGLGPDTQTSPLPHPMYGTLRVGGNVQASKIIKRVQPVYPEEARTRGVTGTVRLHLILGKDGTVKQLELVSGHPLLAQAALDAVRQWTYRQTLLNGEPVEIDTVVDVIFTLNPAPTTNPQ
jgi:TonB family protein